MRCELYQEVALTRDVPEYALHAGDIVTLIDFVDHPHGGEEGCVLEVFNAVGESLTVLTAPVSCIEPLRANEIFTVRAFQQAAYARSWSKSVYHRSAAQHAMQRMV